MYRQKKMTIEQAVSALQALDGGDSEKDHSAADEILLEMVSPAVRKAYLDLVQRASFWANA